MFLRSAVTIFLMGKVMRYLYLDNFRGFSKSTIPIMDVNFLVGENSAGKTSLLTMMRTLAFPPAFMDLSTFSGENFPTFGHFTEMVSAHSSNRKYFRVGMIGSGSKKGNSTDTGILLTYIESAGLPKVSTLTYLDTGREVSLQFKNKTVFFKNKSVDRASSEKMSTQLQRWAREHEDGDSPDWMEFRDLPKPSTADEIPLFVLLGMASKPIDSKEKAFPMIFPNTGPELVWIAPIRGKPRRTYDEPNTSFSPEGAHTPYIIRRILGSKKEAVKFKKFMEEVGKASGLFQKIEIKHFGKASETSPFEVDAYLDGKALSLAWLGYGVSQALPILVELLVRPKSSWFAIQQPEVHLHPRAQASLGDVFFEMALRDNKTFLVETHSDFTIDRFRMNYRPSGRKRGKAKSPESQVLFFERKGGNNVVTSLPIGSHGEMPSEQPEN